MTSKAFGLAQLGNAYADGALSNRNKIINGAMTIDQRNAGAAVTVNGATLYTLDRWRPTDVTSGAFTVQQSTVAPAGFRNSALITVTSAAGSYASTDQADFIQRIEGYNIADLAYGTASAASVSLSFWVRSSVTGDFGGTLQNSAEAYSYPFLFTISAANTWEQKTITVPPATAGTWLTDSGIGLIVRFALAHGSSRLGPAGAWAAADYRGATGQTNLLSTSGATFYITGVQLEAGDTATPFEHRSYGQELALCQRYYWNSPNSLGNLAILGNTPAVNNMYNDYLNPVMMRASPTVALSNFTSVNSGNASVNDANALRLRVESVSGGAGAAYSVFNVEASAEL
jgi:hypothetical protein